MAKSLKDRIRHRLITEHTNLLHKDTLDAEELRELIVRVLDDIIRSEHYGITDDEKDKIINDLVDELAGYGPLDALFKDPSVTEIMVNGPKKVYAERNGKTELTDIVLEGEQQLMYLINKILSSTRRHVDEAYPYTEVAMKDGSRINIVIPPVALDGPTLTIRKFSREIKAIEDLVNLGTMDARMVEFLLACIRAKVNIIFSGATGVGKTTTLNVLSHYISDEERIVTIEDTAELRLSQDHVVRMETRPPNIEGKGEISIRNLFRNSLRMRPDRIIIGEIRGAEALDMLQAICSGHTGSLVVLHANSSQDAVYRLETMILTSGVPISLEVIHRQIASAINLIVQQEQLFDGSRKITYITQVNGLKDGRVVLEDIFTYELEGAGAEGKVKGRWKAAGVYPAFNHIFKKAGINLREDLFRKD